MPEVENLHGSQLMRPAKYSCGHSASSKGRWSQSSAAEQDQANAAMGPNPDQRSHNIVWINDLTRLIIVKSLYFS